MPPFCIFHSLSINSLSFEEQQKQTLYTHGIKTKQAARQKQHNRKIMATIGMECRIIEISLYHPDFMRESDLHPDSHLNRPELSEAANLELIPAIDQDNFVHFVPNCHKLRRQRHRKPQCLPHLLDPI